MSEQSLVCAGDQDRLESDARRELGARTEERVILIAENIAAGDADFGDTWHVEGVDEVGAGLWRQQLGEQELCLLGGVLTDWTMSKGAAIALFREVSNRWRMTAASAAGMSSNCDLFRSGMCAL